MPPDLPMLAAARETLATRDSFIADGNYEAAALVEIDAVETFRKLMGTDRRACATAWFPAALEHACHI
jgi:hypothetical protein